ncbi:stellacyanin [Coffea eugenioides]|uniref:stellacyanin n=1 Tax=Coffea eugenioides TaxID=49369 RepID=UPI000F610A96|nr:stellacyanin [Coffea eugenioides]
MASHSSFSITRTHTLLVLFISSLQLSSVSSFEYQVGDKIGWVVPLANQTKFYNDWASEKRFKVGDTIRFKYRKDSVMEVSETDYKKCTSRRPNFFSNTGNTVFTLDRSGYFYFISGASGYCDKGQRMVVKVMSQDDHNSSPTSSSSASASVALICHRHHHLLFTIPTFHFLLHLASRIGIF